MPEQRLCKDFNDHSKWRNYLQSLILLMSGIKIMPVRPSVGKRVWRRLWKGERFFDLVRWGIVETTMNKLHRCRGQTIAFIVPMHFTGGKDEYYPVPEQSIRIFWRQVCTESGYAPFN